MTAKLGREEGRVGEENEEEIHLFGSLAWFLVLNTHLMRKVHHLLILLSQFLRQRRSPSGFLDEKFNIPSQAGWAFLFLMVNLVCRGLQNFET